MKKLQEFESFDSNKNLNEAKSGFVDFSVLMDCLSMSKKDFNDAYFKDKEEFSSSKTVIANAQEVAKNCKIEKDVPVDDFPQGLNIKKPKYPHVFWFFDSTDQMLVAVSSIHPNLDKMIDKNTYDFNRR